MRIGPPLPAALQTALWMATPLPFLEQCRLRYGSTLLFDFAPMGPNLFVSSPEAIKKIFTVPPDTVRVGDANQVLRPLVGKHSLFLLDGAEHLRHRRLLLPPFHGERMHLYAETIRAATEASVRGWPVGTPFAPGPFFRKITLEVILRAVFGVDAERAASGPLPDLISRYVELGHSWLLFMPGLRRDVGRWSPWGRVLATRRATDAAIYAEVAARRAATHPGDDVLSLLLATRDESGQAMTDRELRDELVTLLMAGHETTATGLEWALDRVLAHPEVHQRLRDEAASGGTEYLDAVIKETLRVRPVLPNVARRLTEPMELDGVAMRAGSYVAPCIYLAHRRPSSWPDPERFQPERFLGRRVDPYAFLPFGGGARRCIGLAFAMLEMRVILSTVLTSTVLTRDGVADARVKRRGITFAPAGFRMVVREMRKAA